jgi:hypothetical protein
MSATSTLNGRPTLRPAVVVNAGTQALEDSQREAPEALPSTDREAATQPAAPPGPLDSASGSPAAERDERRHQRAVAREGNGRGRAAKTGDCLQPGAMGPARRGRLALGEKVSVGLIGIVVVGLGRWGHPGRSGRTGVGRGPARCDSDRDPVGRAPAHPTPALTPVPGKQPEFGGATTLSGRSSRSASAAWIACCCTPT